jgi:hypothetical protein
MIDEGMARAEKMAGGLGHARCFALPDPLDDAPQSWAVSN